jgi:hypothetical protein
MLVASAASAITVNTSGSIATIRLTAGATADITSNVSVFDFGQFILGESVRLEFSIDTGTVGAANGSGTFFSDVAGNLTITGVTSGTQLNFSDFNSSGVELQVFDGALGFRTVRNANTQHDIGVNQSSLFDINVDAGQISTGDTLAEVLAAIENLNGTNTSAGSDTIINYYQDDVNSRRLGLRVGAIVLPVPLPAGAFLLMGALGAAGAVSARRRRKAA